MQTKTSIILAVLLLVASTCYAGTRSEWKMRTVYQVLTDRFARDDSQNFDCNLSNYCGGTYKGIVNKLDYITGMGFNAVCLPKYV